MAERGPSYSDAARKIAEETRLARELYVARCKRMTAQAFLQEPPERLQRLTQAEYADIIRAIAGNPAGPAKPEPPPVAAIVPAKSRRRLCYLWRKTPPAHKASVIGTLTAFILIPLFPVLEALDLLEKPAPVSTMYVADWPSCRRLDPHQDRCRYETRNALDWDYVAMRLGQETSLLRRINRDLTGAFIPAQTRIIVFRPSPAR
jgi:hypothetical protein